MMCKICTGTNQLSSKKRGISWEKWQICVKCFNEIRDEKYRGSKAGDYTHCLFCMKPLKQWKKYTLSTAFCNNSHRQKYHRRLIRKEDAIREWKEYEKLSRKILKVKLK